MKLFQHIVVNQVKETLMNNMSVFQIGTKKGHSPSEHIFMMKSLMQLYEEKKKPLILSYCDFSVFFDSECLIDVLNEVYKCGVKGKAYRLLYKLNRSRLIRVSTPVGATGETHT